MASLESHPTVLKARSHPVIQPKSPIDAGWLKQLALQCGADDAGIVEVERQAITDQRGYIDQVFSGTRALLSYVVRMNREPIRAIARSVANQEFHAVYDEVNLTARKIVRTLQENGIRACNAVAAFPMEVQSPGRTWTVAHKPVAVAAGLGMMGIHRNVIHPQFGNFILLGTILLGEEVSHYDQPIDYNPCLECKLCVAACPVGAIKPDGAFDFMTCYTHNYREFVGNFGDWVGALTDAKNHRDYRRRFSDGETSSMWQSLSFKPGYKAAYCIAVCPAGEDVIGPYLQNKKEYVASVVKPLNDKKETLYVLPGSDAEDYAAHRFPNKTVKRVKRQSRPTSVAAFLMGLRLSFQRGKAKNRSISYHWVFTGKENSLATIRIQDGNLEVQSGHSGTPDVIITADTATWLKVLARDESIYKAILLRKVRVKGDMRLFRAFRRFFP